MLIKNPVMMQNEAFQTRGIRILPIKIITVSKGNSKGSRLMADEWAGKVG
jgi:hypothetical protein